MRLCLHRPSLSAVAKRKIAQLRVADKRPNAMLRHHLADSEACGRGYGEAEKPYEALTSSRSVASPPAE